MDKEDLLNSLEKLYSYATDEYNSEDKKNDEDLEGKDYLQLLFIKKARKEE